MYEIGSKYLKKFKLKLEKALIINVYTYLIHSLLAKNNQKASVKNNKVKAQVVLTKNSSGKNFQLTVQI